MKQTEMILLTMEKLSIILHDESDATASITVKEGLYEHGKIHQESRIGRTGTASKTALFGRDTR
jgi:hypothetical protein